MPIDVVVVVGGRWHDMGFARVQLLKALDRHDDVRVSVHSDYSDIQSLALADALITYTCEVIPTEEQALALNEFVRRGGRWLALHATHSSIEPPVPGGPKIFRTPDAMPSVTRLLGSRFLAHPPIEQYTVQVTQPDHPLVRGMSDFDIVDELYVCWTADDIEVLLHTEFTGDCKGFETSYASGRHPVLYLRQVERGSVCYLTLGHCRGRFDVQDLGIEDLGVRDRRAWQSPELHELIRRTTAWAVGHESIEDVEAS